MSQWQTHVRHRDVFLVLQKRRLGTSSLRGERTCDICFSKGREGKEKSKKEGGSLVEWDLTKKDWSSDGQGWWHTT